PPAQGVVGAAVPSAVLEQLKGAVWSTDAELRVTYAAGPLFREAVPPPRSIAGLTIGEVFGECDPTRAPLAQHLAALTGASQSFRHKWRDRWLDVWVEPLRGDDESVVGCVGSSRDVTDRQVALEGLEASQRRLAAAQRIANIATFEWDVPNDTIVWSDEVRGF